MLKRLRQFRAVLRKPPEDRSLSEKLIFSGMLTATEQAATMVFRLGSTLIVTRLLAPDIFGLFAVVVTFQLILTLITDFGIRSLIIVSDDAKDTEFLQTCWSVQVARGMILFAIVQVLALGLHILQQTGVTPPDTTYGAPILPLAIAASGLQIVLGALESVNQHLHARDLRLARITMLNIASAALTPVLTVAIALVHPTIWALVISGILSGGLRSAASHWLFPGPPMRWCWNRTHAADLYRHGRWIMPNSALTATTNYADQLVFGAFLPPAAVGVYFLAKQLVSVPTTLVVMLQGQVGLQLFRNLAAMPDRAEARSRYYRFRLPIDIIAGLAAGGVLATGTALVDLMYDPRYLEAGRILQILALGLPMIAMNIVQASYAAQKRFHVMTMLSLIRVAVIWGGVILALSVFGNVTAAFLVVALHRAPELVVVAIMARREGWVDLWRELRLLPITVLGALVGWGVSEAYFTIATG